jgi:hypothetical protein
MIKRGRKPGTPKTGGRKPGSPNKVTGELKRWLNSIIEENKPLFEKNLKNLEPEKHVQLIEKLLAYIVPKPQNFDIQIEYRELERLLERTPDQYIERITTKLIELNTLNIKENETPENE